MEKTPYELLEERIRAMNPGDVLPYSCILEILGSPNDRLGDGDRARFYRIQKRLEAEGVVLENVRMVGYRRLNRRGQTLDRVQHYWIPKAHRALGRAKTTLSTVPIGRLRKDDQHRALAMCSLVASAHLNIAPAQVTRRSTQYSGLSTADVRQMVATGFTG